MGRHSYVKAYISDLDETYFKHKKVLVACFEAGVELPLITAEYFGSRDPELYLLDEKLEKEIIFKEYSDDCNEIIEILIQDIPEGTCKIKFINSW